MTSISSLNYYASLISKHFALFENQFLFKIRFQRIIFRNLWNVLIDVVEKVINKSNFNWGVFMDSQKAFEKEAKAISAITMMR